MGIDSMNVFSRKSALVISVVIAALLALAATFELVAQSPQGRPDTDVRVVSFEPQEFTEIESNITVKFSNDLVSEDSLDTPVLDPPLEIEPPLPGLARWIDTDVLRFYPDYGLLPATTFKVRIASDRSYVNGNRINEDRVFSFKTPPLLIRNSRWVTSFDDAPRGHARIVAEIYFNYMIDLEQLKDNLSISGETNAEASSPTFEIEPISETTGALPAEKGGELLKDERHARGVLITSEPIPITDNKQKYYLKIDDELTCLNCGQPLGNEFEMTIYIEPKRRLVIQRMNGRLDGIMGIIEVRFSNQVDVETAAKFITVSPKKDIRFSIRYRSLVIEGDFQPGKTYEVAVAEGLRAVDGTELEREFSQKVTIPNLTPSLRFMSGGIYLPKKESRLLEIETINVKELVIEIDQIFANNIVYMLATDYSSRRNYGRDRQLDYLGRKFFSATENLNGRTNEPLQTTIDIGNIIGDSARGVFKVAIRDKESRWHFDSRLVMLTDIGLAARMSDDYLMVWVNSLSDLNPISKATVNLYSKNNQLILSGRTDSRGIAIFNKIKDNIGDFTPYLITVEKNDDLSFLKFDDCRLETGEFDITGRPYVSEGYESFVYLDRDIFRPGDTVHISSIVRANNGVMPPEFPYQIIINDPAGREFESFRLNTGGKAFGTVDLYIPDFARTGKYQLRVMIGEDYEIGRTEFQVEEFMPDKIKVTVVTPEKAYRSGETIEINVSGKFLFGPPATGHLVEGSIDIEPLRFISSKWPDYAFSDGEREFATVEKKLDEARLSDSGTFAYRFQIPTTYEPPSALKALIAASVKEQGGRAVNNYTEVMIHPYERYVGVKALFAGYAKPGQPAEIGLAAVTPSDSTLVIDTVDVHLYRLIYHSILRKDKNGYYRYESKQTTEPVDSGRVHVPVEGGRVSFIPPRNGRYRVVVTDPKGGHRASTTFYASGWGYAPWSMEHPDRIDLGFDKDIYSPGEQANLQVRAPFGGKLLLTIEKETILDFITLEMEENTAEISIPVKEDYFPNAYITATVIKPAAEADNTSPARAFGIVPLMLSKEKRRLTVGVAAPEVIKPQTSLTLDISVDRPGVTELTVAAVDAGILLLTGYSTPDPVDFFYGKKMLYLQPFDIYSFIYPDLEPAESHLSPAGGRMFKQARKRHLNPIKSRRVTPVALWSGIIKTDENGQATVTFDIPQFNGKLVVMAVAARENLFGCAEKEITVRDHIVLQESFPRFIAPNDIVEAMVTLFNNTGAAADITVTLNVDGPVEILEGNTRTVTLADNAEGAAVFNLKGGLQPANVQCRLTAVSGSNRSTLSFEFPNRPTLPIITRFGSGSVTEEEPVRLVLDSGWVETTERLVFQTSALSSVAFTRNINFLLRYPYGCVEQTTSRLFPLLYFNELARFVNPDLFGNRSHDYFIMEGIDRLLALLQSDGSFSYWPGSKNIHQWSSVYASHFILEADEAGYYIDEDSYDKVLKKLRRISEGKEDEYSIEHRIYAAYALAGIGELKQKAINYLRDYYYGELPDYARYMLSGVMAMTGDTEYARRLIPFDVQPAIFEPETGGNLSSGVRTNAILLDVLNRIDPNHPSAAVMAKSLMENARLGRWYTTQATAFALMALGRYLKGQEEADYAGRLKLIGDRQYEFGIDDFRLVLAEPKSHEAVIEIDGAGRCYYYWQISGIPIGEAAEEYQRGIRITRRYLDADGHQLDLKDVHLGDQIVCEITAEAIDERLHNVIINDLLPAGLEIENPRLKTTPRLSWLPEKRPDVAHMDIRDDRVLIFTDLSPRRSFTFHYSLRAISSGTFSVPPIAAECMYNPLIAGATSSDVMIIRPLRAEEK